MANTQTGTGFTGGESWQLSQEMEQRQNPRLEQAADEEKIRIWIWACSKPKVLRTGAFFLGGKGLFRSRGDSLLCLGDWGWRSGGGAGLFEPQRWKFTIQIKSRLIKFPDEPQYFPLIRFLHCCTRCSGENHGVGNPSKGLHVGQGVWWLRHPFVRPGEIHHKRAGQRAT